MAVVVLSGFEPESKSKNGVYHRACPTAISLSSHKVACGNHCEYLILKRSNHIRTAREAMMSEEERIRHFMEAAIALSLAGMHDNKGGPFGAIVVKNDKIIGCGCNQVTSGNDPTAHAEIVAIRDACNNLGSFDLTGCELYTSCEPCPMCLGAIYWARPKTVYYANTRDDAAAIGFDDQFIYSEMTKSLAERKYPLVRVDCANALEPFREWREKADKACY